MSRRYEKSYIENKELVDRASHIGDLDLAESYYKRVIADVEQLGHIDDKMYSEYH